MAARVRSKFWLFHICYDLILFTLHVSTSNAIVTLTTHENERVKITGITSDYGLLETVSIDNPGKRVTLQPDGNSFDMLKGLIVRKQ
jgi:hypothetical protein